MPKALALKKIEGGKPGQVYYPLVLKEIPKPASPGPNELLIRLNAAALNHRDLFIRQHLYPGISWDTPMLADGYGTVVEAGPNCKTNLVNKPVVLTPCRGWESSPEGPEDMLKYAVLGSTVSYDLGMAQEYIVVSEDEVEPAPEHLTPAEGAALPLVGLTGWRALVTKSANAEPGRNILITGIGGGVALQVLQFAVAKECNVFVTSGDEAKLEKAKKMGAKGGVIYKAPDWEKQLQKMLPEDRPYLDAVVDGAGGDIMKRVIRIIKPGGIISSYGMTLAPKMDWIAQAFMKNVELRGSTMGSRKEFKEMMDFVREKKIRPVVSRVVKGLDNLEALDGLFTEMHEGKQFGKLVIEINPDRPDSPSKL
ncbi:putative oxidoreductase protein [Phaeoacremonium minimum UCRPA7]|uniref:Putative oxidoreductase protein n=1 Tax=Phaeoacremonium minimum (strain UCR-PA7) TaxID=1286976 RepID=R8BI17_PHAM7|nr:putative oxidoreductase protein [Phaeoacremonium minimum UCRPA7]EON98914.1 putative oxidoreductase protein [Phaeoacremonium minimum UCRPA7]